MIYEISFIPVTTRCGVVVQLEVDGVGGRGGDAASTGCEESLLFHGESGSGSIVDNESETQICLISWECTVLKCISVWYGNSSNPGLQSSTESRALS